MTRSEDNQHCSFFLPFLLHVLLDWFRQIYQYVIGGGVLNFCQQPWRRQLKLVKGREFFWNEFPNAGNNKKHTGSILCPRFTNGLSSFGIGWQRQYTDNHIPICTFRVWKCLTIDLEWKQVARYSNYVTAKWGQFLYYCTFMYVQEVKQNQGFSLCNTWKWFLTYYQGICLRSSQRNKRKLKLWLTS